MLLITLVSIQFLILVFVILEKHIENTVTKQKVLQNNIDSVYQIVKQYEKLLREFKDNPYFLDFFFINKKKLGNKNVNEVWLLVKSEQKTILIITDVYYQNNKLHIGGVFRLIKIPVYVYKTGLFVSKNMINSLFSFQTSTTLVKYILGVIKISILSLSTLLIYYFVTSPLLF